MERRKESQETKTSGNGPRERTWLLRSPFHSLLSRLEALMPFAFEKLQVYQKAVTFADAICTLSRDFPRGYFFPADQLNRAALSIAAILPKATAASRRPTAATSSALPGAACRNACRCWNSPHARDSCSPSAISISKSTWRRSRARSPV